jgi:hypothetical protein
VAESVFEYRVDLVLALISVVGQVGGLFGPGELAGQFGQNERLEERAERRTRTKQRPGFDRDLVGGDAGINEDQFWSGGGSWAVPRLPRRALPQRHRGWLDPGRQLAHHHRDRDPFAGVDAAIPAEFRPNSGPPAPDPRPENSEGRATTIITAGAITGFTAILSAVGLTILVH